MNTTEIRKGVLVIVYGENGNFLLLKQTKSSLWGFISGGIESGETDVEAALRESMEEAGLKIESDNLFKTEKIIRFVNLRGPGEQVVFIYKMNQGPVKIDNDEICEYGWFPKKDALLNLEAKPPLKQLILDLFPN